MNTTHHIAIFKAGRHADMNGTTIEITNAHLKKTVAAYDPARWKAPLVIGHPHHDAPAWGWIASLSLKEETLFATLTELSPQVIDLVTQGQYRNVSASFYTPDATSNPVPGLFYLRHVGLLGAQPPAVKGLPQVAFHEPENQTALAVGCDMATPKEWSTASTLPESMEHTMAENDEKNQLEQQRTQLTRQEESLKAQALLFAEQEAQIAKREETLRQAENDLQQQKAAEFVDGLIADGKILPRFREGLLTFMSFLSQSGIVEFGEDQGQMGFLKTFLQELPQQVEYAERTPKMGQDLKSAHFHLPDGYTADAEGMVMHTKILSWANAHKTDYLTAALAVSA